MGYRLITIEELAEAASRADTHPSAAAIEAGNYKHGHISLHGLGITIENDKGSIRRGVGPNGKAWSVRMPAIYGYFKRTEGADGDHVDVYVGPSPHSRKVWVIDQKDANTGNFDEHKVMMGYTSLSSALDDYRAAFSDGRGDERIGSVTEMSIEQFKSWVKTEDTTDPYAMMRKAVHVAVKAIKPAPTIPTIQNGRESDDTGDVRQNSIMDLPMGGAKGQAPFQHYDNYQIEPGIPNSSSTEDSEDDPFKDRKATGMYGVPMSWSEDFSDILVQLEKSRKTKGN